MRVDAAANRHRIIEAFLSLVDERSLEPTMAAVAAEAHVARITLYRHLADREALRRAAFVRVLDDLFFWSLQGAAVSVTLRSERDPAAIVVAAFLDGARPPAR